MSEYFDAADVALAVEAKEVGDRPYTLWVRYRVEVNTDPQRRCYDGCHFSSKHVWTEWRDLFSVYSLKDAQESAKTFAEINPKNREYKVTFGAEKP